MNRSLESRAEAFGRPLADPHDEEMARWHAAPRGEPDRPVLRPVDARSEAGGESETYDTVSIQGVDFAALADKTPPPRRWVVTDWIPRGAVTLLVGKGGVGKSLLAQQLGTTIAAAQDWLGVVPCHGAVVGLFCEDDHDELWRRQVDICRSLGVPMDGVGQWLTYDARAGRMNALTYTDPRGGILGSPLVDEVRRVLQSTSEAQLLILDNIGQMFVAGDGGENDKAKVTQFCNMLTGIALEFKIGVLLLAHPAKADGSEWSGNVAWDAAVRSRLLLERESDEPNSRVILRRPKANYASRDDRVAFSWERGAFIRTDGRQSVADAVAASARATEVRIAIESSLRWLADRKMAASHKKQASNFLPKLMQRYGLGAGYSSREIVEALDSLIADQRVEVDASLWKNDRRQVVAGLRWTAEQPSAQQGALTGGPHYMGDQPLSTPLTSRRTDEQKLLTGEQTDEQTGNAA